MSKFDDNSLSMEEPEGLYIPSTDFDKVSKAYNEALRDLVQAQMAVADTQDDLEGIGLGVEMAVIAEHNNDEKKVGSTEAARNRAYALAKEKSEPYRAARAMHRGAKADYRYQQGMVRLLDLRLQFINGANKGTD